MASNIPLVRELELSKASNGRTETQALKWIRDHLEQQYPTKDLQAQITREALSRTLYAIMVIADPAAPQANNTSAKARTPRAPSILAAADLGGQSSKGKRSNAVPDLIPSVTNLEKLCRLAQQLRQQLRDLLAEERAAATSDD